MTREKIQELVETKKIELSKSYQKDKGYDYCREYVLNNEMTDISEFTNVDIWYLMKCLYYINNKENSIEKIEELFDSFKPFFESTNIETIHQFIDITVEIDEAGNIDNVINYLDNKRMNYVGYVNNDKKDEYVNYTYENTNN